MKEFLKKAKKAARSRDFSTAGDFYALAGQVDKAMAAYRKGGHHAQVARLAEELGDYQAAAEAHSRSGQLRSAAEMWLKAECPDRAWRMYKRGGDMLNAGEVLEKMGRPVEAASLYKQGNLKERAARLYARHNEPVEALGLLEKLIEETKRDSIHLDVVEKEQRVRRFSEVCGKLYLKLDNKAAAAPMLERAGLLREAACVFREAGEHSRAVETFIRAGLDEEAMRLIESQPQTVFEPRLLADLLQRRGEHARAAEQFLAAGEPGMASECFEHAGLTLKAAEAARAARDLHGAARLYSAAGEWKTAAELYHEAHAPAEAAACLERAGDPAAAGERYLEAGAHLKAARILFGRGELDRCIEVLQRIPRDSEDVEEGNLLLGEIFEHKALFSLAVDCYRRALDGRQAEPETLPILYRLGRVLEKSGRGDEARPLYEQIAAADFKYEDVAARVTALSGSGSAPGASSPTPALERVDLEERFEKLTTLGRDLGGAVFLGRERSSGLPVRIRRVALDPERDVAKALRLLEEAKRLERLRHPGIASLLAAGLDDNGLYYVSEQHEGKTLQETLREGGAPDFGTVVALLVRLAEALDYAHSQSCLCRNLRPDTILITSQREVLILDFGLALRLTEPSAGGGNEAALRYAPPELLLRERLDARSDLYCLGLVGLEATTGLAPGAPGAGGGLGEPPKFPDPSARRVPVLLRQVVERCLKRDRNQRYASASELIAELQGTQFLPGAIVANRYEIVREAGRGGMGEVYEARDLVLDERVALKTLSGTLDETAQRRFVNEIKLARKITHPNVVRVFTFEQWREQRFIVMEYIEGANLVHWLKRGGLPPIEEAVRIGCGIAEGLAQAHALGIVHRDIKPENILIDPTGRPRILDFGIARLDDSSLTQTGMTLGSPRYMSPEQVEGRCVDARSDLYSLGLVLYLLLTGREAFSGPDTRSILIQQLQKAPEPPRALRPELPEALERTLLSLLAKDPGQRPQSAPEVASTLAVYAGAAAPAPAG
ncbi:MAG: protein kinase [Acidobacteriota bacterium]